MFKTFKASIETENDGKNELLKRGTVFRFGPGYTSEEYVLYNIRHEVFKFSKEDVIFSKKQKEQYKDYLRLNPFSGGQFCDGVKYKLIRLHEKGNTKYVISVDGNKATLKLNWINKRIIEWVHGRKINWTIWQVTVATIGVIVVGTVGYFNYNKSTVPPTNKDTLKKSNTNQLPSHVVDTITKKDSIKTYNPYSDTSTDLHNKQKQKN